MTESYAIGADIGGSHISCQLFDLHTFQPLPYPEIRMAVDSRGSAETIIQAWSSAIAEAASDLELSTLAGIGVAMPGPFDYLQGIGWFRNVEKFDALYGYDVRNALKSALTLPESFRLRFINDATAFALGEAIAGKAAHRSRIIAITLGSGFGATFMSDRLPVTNDPSLPENGYLYNLPFKDSIADEYFSTRWFVNRFMELTGQKIAHVKELIATDTQMADRMMQEFGFNLGLFMSPWIKTFRAESLIIGGNIAREMERFAPSLQKSLSLAGHSTECLQAAEGEISALMGSAALCSDDFYARINP